MNYTISEPDSYQEWLYHNHSFYVPYNYTFINVTFGNGITKSIISGFQLVSFNVSHNQVIYEVYSPDSIEGNFTWFFLTGNAITDLIINPQWSINGTLTNQSLIQYNIRVANDSIGISAYPLNITIKNSNETILFSVEDTTGIDGWLNSSFDEEFVMETDHQYWIVVTGLNSSFLGYAVDYFLGYYDWNAPVIASMTYDETLAAGSNWALDVSLSEDHTNISDLTVTMYYSYISSTSEDLEDSLSFADNLWSISLNGRDADTTIWFRIEAIDNVSNVVSSATLSSTWELPVEPDVGGDTGGGGNGGTPAAAVSADGGDDDLMLILVFAAGAIMVAVLGYAVMRRVTVRTRRVETREVVTSIGRFGRSKEKIEEKGG
jgi:hypothetical protein